MFCHQCGKEIGDVKFCPFCGAEQTGQETTQQDNQGYQPINQDPYQQQSYQQSYGRSDDQPNAGFAILSFFIPIVGLVLYFVWNKEFPNKAKSCLKGLIAGIVLYVVMVCCIISAGIGMASQYDDDSFYYNAIVETVPYE